jgi:hypothetical protein
VLRFFLWGFAKPDVVVDVYFVGVFNQLAETDKSLWSMDLWLEPEVHGPCVKAEAADPAQPNEPFKNQ